MSRSDIEAEEAAKTDSELFRLVKASIQTRDNASVEAVVPGRSANPENVRRVEAIITSSVWEYLFPRRNSAYTYTKFLRAVAKFRGLCATYTDGRNSDAICRKSLATMFAHFAQETGGHNAADTVPEWRQALVFVREAGCVENGSGGCGYNAECSPGTWQGQAWPCGTNADGSYKQYFGRGAKQLSYNYNYGPFSQAMFGDIRVLLDDPAQVADTWLNVASAVYFFVTPQSPKPSMLHVVDGTWVPNAHDQSRGISPGFGATTNIINGGIECGHGSETQQSLNRIEYYQAFTQELGVPIGSNEVLGCANQDSFDTGGAGALLIYWDQDWDYYPDRPEGKSWACKLVGYQTAHNALLDGDYEKCVVKYFDVEVTGQ